MRVPGRKREASIPENLSEALDWRSAENRGRTRGSAFAAISVGDGLAFPLIVYLTGGPRAD